MTRTRRRQQRKNNRKTRVRTVKGGAPFFFEPQERWEDGTIKLFCGKHAFNNLVGRPLMRMHDIYEMLGIDDEEQLTYEGNLTNEELQLIINTLEPRSYSAFMDLEFMTRANNIGNITDEIIYDRAFYTKAGKLREMSEEVKEYIRMLYSVLLAVRRRAPNLTGFILQITYQGDKGHYIALKRLASGHLQVIDSLNEKDAREENRATVPFLADDSATYRHNCALVIAKIFELAGITKYTMKKIGPPDGKLAQLIIIKPYETANNFS